MKDKTTPTRLKALPVQFIEIDNGVILKRGRVEMRLGGENAAEAAQIILEATFEGATAEEIVEIFAEPDRESVSYLIQQLLDRRILVPYDTIIDTEDSSENSLDIFYWHFGARTDEVRKFAGDLSFVIIGVNTITRQLAGALAASGIENFQIVDYPLLRNLRMFDDQGVLNSHQWPGHLPHVVEYQSWKNKLDSINFNCLIACSDFGGQQLMREWNALCIRKKCHFLPVVLQDLIGYIGPLVVPGETACYECLRARQNSHMRDPQSQRAGEYQAFEGQEIIGFHPSMASILGDLTAIELMKFYVMGPPLWRAGSLIEANLLTTEIFVRKVLKIPRCPACSNLIEQPSTALTKTFYLPDSLTSE